jgi:hypothetical protein
MSPFIQRNVLMNISVKDESVIWTFLLFSLWYCLKSEFYYLSLPHKIILLNDLKYIVCNFQSSTTTKTSFVNILVWSKTNVIIYNNNKKNNNKIINN